MTAVAPIPSSAPPADPGACAACRAPLAGSARYCLRCGGRQPAARIDLLGLVAAPGRTAPASAPVSPAAGPVPAPPPASVLAPPGPAAARAWPGALVAVVVVALLLGLLGGQWIADRRGGQEDAPVVRVGDAPSPAGAAAPSDAAPAPAPEASARGAASAAGTSAPAAAVPPPAGAAPAAAQADPAAER